jgi:hypothetical protein
MAKLNVELVRPLLSFSKVSAQCSLLVSRMRVLTQAKANLIETCRARQLAWVEDPSNFKPDSYRSTVRASLELIYKSFPREQLAALVSGVGDAVSVVDEPARQFVLKHAVADQRFQFVAVPMRELMSLPRLVAARVIRRIYHALHNVPLAAQKAKKAFDELYEKHVHKQSGYVMLDAVQIEVERGKSSRAVFVLRAPNHKQFELGQLFKWGRYEISVRRAKPKPDEQAEQAEQEEKEEAKQAGDAKNQVAIETDEKPVFNVHFLTFQQASEYRVKRVVGELPRAALINLPIVSCGKEVVGVPHARPNLGKGFRVAALASPIVLDE